MQGLNASLHANKTVSWAPNPIKQDWKSPDRNWPDRWLLWFHFFHLTAVHFAVCCNTVCNQGLRWRHSKDPPHPSHLLKCDNTCIPFIARWFHCCLSGPFYGHSCSPQSIRSPLTGSYHLLNYPWQRVSTNLHIFEVLNQVSSVLMEDSSSAWCFMVWDLQTNEGHALLQLPLYAVHCLYIARWMELVAEK